MKETSYKEFVQWNKLEELEYVQHDNIDYYLAQVALVTASCFSAEKFKISDFLIDFGRKEPISEIDKMKQSISAWELATKKKATFKGGS